MQKIEIIERIKRYPMVTEEMLKDVFGVLLGIEDKKSVDHYVKWVRAEAMKIKTADMFTLVKQTYIYAAQGGDFDSYCIALEWERSPEKRFYLPRREVLKPLVDDLQDLFEYLSDAEVVKYEPYKPVFYFE
jgi:hypothetical protein